MRRTSQVLEEYEQQPWTCGELSSLALHLLILNLRCTIAWVCKVLKNKCSRSDGWFLLQLNGFEEQRAGLQSINPEKSDANWSSDITMTGRCVAEFRPHFAHFRTKRSCKSWSQAGIFARGNLSREVRAPYQSTQCDGARLLTLVVFSSLRWLSRTLVMEGNLGEKSWDLLRVLGMALKLRT